MKETVGLWADCDLTYLYHLESQGVVRVDLGCDLLPLHLWPRLWDAVCGVCVCLCVCVCVCRG